MMLLNMEFIIHLMNLKRIREAAPTCFMQSGGAVNVASEYEAMKLSHKYLDIGADVVYGGQLEL